MGIRKPSLSVTEARRLATVRSTETLPEAPLDHEAASLLPTAEPCNEQVSRAASAGLLTPRLRGTDVSRDVRPTWPPQPGL